jgi:hypothetical protein
MITRCPEMLIACASEGGSVVTSSTVDATKKAGELPPFGMPRVQYTIVIDDHVS